MPKTDMPERNRRDQRHAETKQAILDAARALILEKGTEHVALREIARRMEHSPAGLYEYFGGKDEIIAAVAAEAFERLSAYLNYIPKHLPPAQRVIEIGLAYVNFARHNAEHFMLIFSRLPSGRTSTQQPPSAGSPYQTLLGAIQDGISTGEFVARPDYGVEHMAYGLWALVHGMAMLQQTHLQRFEADFAAVDRRTLEAFVKGLTRA